MTLTFEIKKKLNKSGKKFVYYATINGKRITKYNHYRKWEAKSNLDHFVKHYGEQRIKEMLQA